MSPITTLFDDWRIALASLAVCGISLYLISSSMAGAKKTGIPGPNGLPLIGNAHQMPPDRPWLTFSSWKQLYGDIIHLNILGKPIIVLNSSKIAKDLMDKKSSIYSDRPILLMAKLCGFYDNFVLLPYGNEWRNQRRLIVHDFSPSMTPRYYELQETAARTLVRNLLKKPESFRDEIQLRIGMIILRVAYGYKVESRADPMLSMALAVLRNFSFAIAPGQWIVDIIPALQYIPKWFPGAGFRKTADDWRNLTIAGLQNPYFWCKANTLQETGKALSPSLCGRYIEETGENMTPEAEFSLVWAAAAVFGGGLDTNMSAVLTFFRAMIANPHVVAKAQEEIDRVIGRDRLPSIDDRPNLPYVRSVIAEVLRYGPPAPMGVAHSVTQDDYYEGYFIPKGSIILPNIWHMTHDPEIYPNPDKFDPDRFEGQDSEMGKIYDLVFGFGRRVCPGLHLAQGTLFAIVATTLATCDVLPGLDRSGRGLMPTTDYENGSIVMPEPYSLRLKPRSTHAVNLLSEASAEID